MAKKDNIDENKLFKFNMLNTYINIYNDENYLFGNNEIIDKFNNIYANILLPIYNSYENKEIITIVLQSLIVKYTWKLNKDKINKFLNNLDNML
jgi:hypothetical protein